MATSSLYERDFYGWVQEQTRLLCGGQFHAVDMGKRQKQERISRLRFLSMHLLQWKYQPEHRSRSGSAAIQIQRFDILEHLDQNPSLRSIIDFSITKAWRDALVDAESETHLPLSHFPEEYPWTFASFMEADFWPRSTYSETVAEK